MSFNLFLPMCIDLFTGFQCVFTFVEMSMLSLSFGDTRGVLKVQCYGAMCNSAIS